VTGLQRGKGSQWVYSVIIIGGGSANAVCKTEGRRVKACVDYHALNLVIVKNCYPLPLMSEMLERIREARKFTKLHLRSACNHI